MARLPVVGADTDTWGTVLNDQILQQHNDNGTHKAGFLVDSYVSASAAIARSKLNFGSGLVNADLAAGAGITYAKLALAGAIVNADISGSAAIGIAKLAGYPGNAGLFLRGDGTWASVTVGGSDWVVNAKTASYTLTYTDSNAALVTIFALANADMTLPTAVGHVGARFIIARTDADYTKTVRVLTTSSQTINGVTTWEADPRTTWQFLSDGSNWVVIGSVLGPTVSRSSAISTTLRNSDDYLTMTAAGTTATLHSAVTARVKNYTVKSKVSGTVTVATTSSQTIDGSPTFALGQYDSATFLPDGTNWMIV